MKHYPAIDVRSDAPDLLLAIVDDFGPTAVEERGSSVRLFFATASDRDGAQQALAAQFDVSAIEVDDEDWARRSQENLAPVTVGRITVAPPWVAGSHSPAISHARPATSHEPSATSHEPSASSHQPSAIRVVILPSMGFGTGHHVTTRLCLAALQTIDLTDRDLLDVGTGSGVLAIAADRLGAARAIGIDFDPDAIQSARGNLDLNPETRHVTFETIDLAACALPPSDVVAANLTGALLIRSAGALLGAVRPGGTVILSGIQSHERDEVRRAFAGAEVCWEREEDGWVGIAVKKR
jgi:ribosomal protein L11 methyltransferase